MAVFKAVHCREGGPCPVGPSNPPKSFEAWYSYTL